MPIGEACQKLFERIPVAEANFFGIVIAIQSRAGGNLSEALGNLSRVLRDRKKMKAKIQAMSMEAKASASIIACLPIAVMCLVYLTSPAYIELLWTHPIGPHDAGRLRDVDVHRRPGHAQDDQLRLLMRGTMIELIADNLTNTRVLAMVFAAIAAAATVSPSRCRCSATDSLAKRMKSVALEREKMRQRERERMARGEKVVAAPVAQAVHAAHRRAVQPEQVARPGGSARAAGAGRLPRPGALRDVPVLPAGDAGRCCSRSRCSTCSSCSSSTQPTSVKVGICLAADLSRHQAAGAVPQEQDRQAPAIDQARLPGRARPAADLRRVRHVDRSRLQEGVGRDRLAVDPAGRGADADHRGAVLPARTASRPTRTSPSAPTSTA